MRSTKSALSVLDPIPENVKSLPNTPTGIHGMPAWPARGDDYHGIVPGGGYLNSSHSGDLPYSVYGSQSLSDHVGRTDDNWETRSVDRNQRTDNLRVPSSHRMRNNLPSPKPSYSSLGWVSGVEGHAKNNVNDINYQLQVPKSNKRDSIKSTKSKTKTSSANFINAFEGSLAGASVETTKDVPQSKSQKASSTTSVPIQTIQEGSSQITVLDGASGQPIATVAIPSSFLQRSCMSRLKKMLAPITMLLIVIALLVALVATIYLAVALKESKDRQIALLQATLDLAMAQQSRDYNILTSAESQQLQASYCHEVDGVFATTDYNPHYRGCDVNTLNNQRIVFHLFFLKESKVERGDEIIEVLARHSTAQSVEGETLIVTFANITVDISESTRLVTLESTIFPEVFYGEDSQRATEDILIESSVSNDSFDKDTNGSSLQVDDSICATISEANIAPHPSSCSHYITCSNLKAEVMQCSGNLVFDPHNLVCTDPTPDLPCVEIEPCINLNGGYYADPYNCQHYVVCDQGVSVIKTCGYDKVWDDNIKTCVPRERGTEC